MIFEFRFSNFDCLRGGLSPSHDFGRRVTGSRRGETGELPPKIAIAVVPESKF
jgi:hypothetical protein